MVSTALIFADALVERGPDAAVADAPDQPRSLLVVGGLTLIERQLRQLADVGIGRVRILSRAFPELLHERLQNFRKIPDDCAVIDLNVPVGTGALAGGADSLLMLQDGVLLDDRIVRTVAHSTAPAAIALYPPRAVVFGQRAGTTLEVEGDQRLFASAAKIPAALLKTLGEAAWQERPPVDSMTSLLDAAVADKATRQIDIQAMETYLPDRRRKVPILWRPVSTEAECARATRVLLQMAQKGVLDWPARWIHPVFEDLLVLALLRSFITPNMVTFLTAVAGAGVAYLFATGLMGWALAGAMAIGVLDGVDGKLARTKRLSSKVGELEHLVDKIVEYAWYLAIAYHLSRPATETEVAGISLPESGSDTAPWALALIIVGFALAEAVQGEFFRRLTGCQLDDAGILERNVRIFAARRNTIIWSFVPFALTEKWYLGFWVMAIYTTMTFFVAQWRFVIRLRDYALSHASDIAGNIKATDYF